jgi:methyltransferase
MSAILFTVFVAFVAVERLGEMAISARHARWAFARGGVEHARRQMPWMVALHAGLLAGSVAEVWLLGRPFLPWLGWPALLVALGCQMARYTIVQELGRRWNTRVIVIPGMPPVRSGIYRRLRHPNYAVVAIEGIALPLVHTAWITAVAFTVLNAVLLLGFRIPAEDRALRSAAEEPAQ